MMTMQMNGDANPTVQIPHFDYHLDPTAHNHFLLTPNTNHPDNLMSPETLTKLHRYLPSNNHHHHHHHLNDSDEFDIPADTFSSDHFRMFEFKIRKCTRGRPHDWTECPFAHSGEKARRRDPRKFHYSGNPCPEFRKGYCSRGEACENAHGVFECWLHPSRYRTLPCKDGVYCRRRACFFAHAPDQLRVLPRATEFLDDSPRSGVSIDSFLRSGNGSPPETMSEWSEWTESPPVSPGWNSVSGLTESMRGLHVGRMGRVNMSPPGWGCNTGFCSPRSPVPTQPVFMSLPSTPTRRPTHSGLGMLDFWEDCCEEEPAMERVESGRDLRARIYSKLSKENSFESSAPGPDIGWVSELLK